MGVLAAWSVARVLVRRWSSVPEWTPCTRWVWALPPTRWYRCRGTDYKTSVLVRSSSALLYVM